ncbi:MAG TPA: hypothetical protein VFW75_02785 [Acetobacteraceae bacterium]|nr:hypothetical protein [Acetobacteraceae bacterium]
MQALQVGPSLSVGAVSAQTVALVDSRPLSQQAVLVCLPPRGDAERSEDSMGSG